VIKFQATAKKLGKAGVDWLSFRSEGSIFTASRLVSEASLATDVSRILPEIQIINASVEAGYSYVEFKGGSMYFVYDADGEFVKETGSWSDAKRTARRKKGYVTDDKGLVVWPKEPRE